MTLFLFCGFKGVSLMKKQADTFLFLFIHFWKFHTWVLHLSHFYPLLSSLCLLSCYVPQLPLKSMVSYSSIIIVSYTHTHTHLLSPLSVAHMYMFLRLISCYWCVHFKKKINSYCDLFSKVIELLGIIDSWNDSFHFITLLTMTYGYMVIWFMPHEHHS